MTAPVVKGSGHATRPKRHSTLYLSDGTHVLQVENTLYKLHKFTLSRFSRIFKDMFDAGELTEHINNQISESQVEETLLEVEGSGRSDSCPIILEQLNCADWEPFICMAFGEWPERPYTRRSLSAFLELSRRYQAETVRIWVDQALSSYSYYFEPYELISFVREYKLGTGVLRAGFVGLLDTPLHELDQTALRMIGREVYDEVTRLKEAMFIHRRIVATEPPEIKAHHADCRDPELCDAHWRGVWWNGMGKMLMDGRTELSYEEALERFVLMEFGEMGVGCKKAMLDKVKEGKAFRITGPLVEAALNRLKPIVL